MASFHGGGNVGKSYYRPQYICHDCNGIFSPHPSTPLSDILCDNCKGDSFEEFSYGAGDGDSRTQYICDLCHGLSYDNYCPHCNGGDDHSVNGGNEGDSDGGHRPPYICHHCEHMYSLFPSTPSSDIFCPDCNGDSFEEFQTPFSNIPPQVVATVAAARGFTAKISIPSTLLYVGDKQIGVTKSASATFQVPAVDLTNGNFAKQIEQFIINTFMSPGGQRRRGP